MSRVTISIVIPAFNVAKYVTSALDSICSQTRPPDEVIVIEDGSTDGTSDIVAMYAELPGWRVIKTINNGLGPARNLGRSLASSNYVYFFDSDDLLTSDFIADICTIIKEHDYPDMVMFSGKSFVDEGLTENFTQDGYYTRNFEGVFLRDDGLLARLSVSSTNPASACLYVTRVDLWAENRLLFPPIIHEDEAVLFPLIALSRKTVVLEKAYFMRRVRAGSIMTSGQSVKNITGILHVLNITMEFMVARHDLICADLETWRSRIASLGLRYVGMCRQLHQPVSLIIVFGSMLKVRKFSYSTRILYCFVPERFKRQWRALKAVWGHRAS